MEIVVFQPSIFRELSLSFTEKRRESIFSFFLMSPRSSWSNLDLFSLTTQNRPICPCLVDLHLSFCSRQKLVSGASPNLLPSKNRSLLRGWFRNKKHQPVPNSLAAKPWIKAKTIGTVRGFVSENAYGTNLQPCFVFVKISFSFWGPFSVHSFEALLCELS